MQIPNSLHAGIAALRQDQRSGASLLTGRAVALLAEARELGCILDVAAALCAAQPAMASIWNASLSALLEDGPDSEHDREGDLGHDGRHSGQDHHRGLPGGLDWFDHRRRRAAAALERFAVPALLPEPPRPMRVATLSASGSVLGVVQALARRIAVQVRCGEGRPVFEGRDMACALADAGVAVEFFTDAALGSIVEQTDAVLVGADAIGPERFLNKTGTRMLAAAAQHQGVAVYVIATSDKLVMPALWPSLAATPGAPGEVWDAAPPSIAVRNPYFESVPLDLATAVLSDLGVLGTDMLPAACAALDTAAARRALAELLRAFDVHRSNPPS